VSGIDNLRGRANEATFENVRYSRARIAFDVPADWTFGGNPARRGRVLDRAAARHQFPAWTSERKATPQDLPAVLARAIPLKTEQRALQRYQAWRVRPESVQETSIGGHAALVAIADFKLRGSGQARVECMTWEFTPESPSSFSPSSAQTNS
jgi:hypothetical protein